MNADGAAGAPRAACVALGLGLAALTLPFDARWLDFEATRRALACVLGAVGFLAFVLLRATPRIRGGWFLALLCAWAVARTIGVTNGGEARLRAAYWIVLAVAVPVGASFTLRQLALVALPTGLVVAAYGIAQQFGFEWPADYGSAREAVSTLGNRNVAAECELLAFACAAWWVATAQRRGLVGLVLLVTVFALGLNGTRAALVAVLLVVGLAWARAGSLARSRRCQWLTCAIVAVGVGAFAGLSTDRGPGLYARPEPSAVYSTIDVRLALWKGVLAMVADAPLFGHGSGQLRFEYPRFRTQDEIEASTLGRQFPTLVDSAHDDYLELAAELGLVGVALCGAFLVAALRGRRLVEMLPVCAFGVVALARAPTGNAPAAIVAALWLGALARQGENTAPRARLVRAAILAWAVSALLLAAPGVLAASDAAAWLRTQDAARLDAAIERHPSEPRHRSLRIRARCGGIEDDGTLVRRGRAEFETCRADLDALAKLDPLNTESLWLRAQLAHGAGERALA
ncbi:MAG: O-antigen ligase family protein, partial [Planctomycetes bacterium]|nr:O-antigen ligase family protein [Planctomycetota bacterium]